jgi:DNA-directed RNA polymerase subunit RPC12/RpoP
MTTYHTDVTVNLPAPSDIELEAADRKRSVYGVRVACYTRHDVVMTSGMHYSYPAFCNRYVCQHCGGSLVPFHHWDEDNGGWTHGVKCGDCQSREFIGERRYMRELTEAAPVTAEQAVTDLFDIA